MNEYLQSPKISVIIPTYNYAKYIGGAIKSVLEQTYRNLEIIVIDNYSEDQTEDIVLSFNNELIRYHKFKNHGIIAAARNFGISQARGDYVAFLDADDAWLPTKTEEQLKHFQEKDLVGVGTDAVYLSDTPYYRKLDFGKSKNEYNDYDYESILSGNPIKTSSVIVRRGLLKELGGFDENPKFKFIEDYELWLRMARFGKFRILGKELIIYRMHFDKSRKNLEVAKNLNDILKKHIKNGYIKEEKIIQEAKATINFSIGYNLIFGNSYEGRKYFMDAFRKSKIFNKKVKSLIGYSLSIMPPVFRKPVNYLIHKMDKFVQLLSKEHKGSVT